MKQPYQQFTSYQNMKRYSRITILLGIFCFFTIGAQFGVLFNQNIPVKDNENLFPNELPLGSNAPIGLIGLWSGALNTIPEGWTLCNGSNGSPDLRNRFVQGVANEEDPGVTGGWESHNHTYDEVPQHTHSITDLGHSHGITKDSFQANTGTGTEYLSSSTGDPSYDSSSSTTGMSVNDNGIAICETENASSMPPYYELAYIMKYNVDALVPNGIILLWAGTLATIPSGWILCDGTSGTPNLVNRFVYGVENEENPGTTGGWATHNHTYTELPIHNHAVNDPGHSHPVYYNTVLSSGSQSVHTVYQNPATYSGYSSFSPTGISIDETGIDNPSTENYSVLPNYYEIAFIMKIEGISSIPKNVIGMWADSFESIPSSWNFCNGSSSTPDLRDRFLRGVTSIQDPGTTGGSSIPDGHIHTYSQVPKHSHGYSETPHRHLVYYETDVVDNSGSSYDFVVGAGIGGSIGTSTTGITLQLSGTVNPSTDSANYVPPYYRLAFIQHQTTEPEAHYVSISPDPVLTNESLNAVYTFYDPDAGDTESGTQIRWYKNGNPQSDFDDDPQVHHMYTNKSDQWYFTVQPGDGIELGNITQSQTVTIANAIPYITNIIITPSNPNTTSTLHLEYTFVDPDGDSDWSTIRWFKNDEEQVTFVNRTDIYANEIAYDEKWNCTITPYDAEDIGPVGASAIIEIENFVPYIRDIVITPTNPTTLSNLHLSYEFVDADDDANWSTIRWYKNNAEQITLENRTDIYASEIAYGEKWNCTITPFDGKEFGILNKSAIITVINTPPTITNIQINPNPAYYVHNLVLTYDYHDDDGHDELDTEIIWYRNNIEQTDYENETTILAIDTSEGDVWNCTIRPKDGINFGSLVWSPNRLITTNSLPIVSGVSINPFPAYEGSILTLSYTYYDANGQLEMETEIIWYKNGVEQTDFEDQTVIPGTAIFAGDVWNATIRVNDGIEYGALVWSPKRVISINDIPSFSVEPADTTIVVGTTGNILEWTAYDFSYGTTSFVVLMNNAPYNPAKITIVGFDVTVDVDGLSLGIYEFNVTFNDGVGKKVSSVITLTVATRMPPTPFEQFLQTLPFIGIGAAVIVVGSVVLSKSIKSKKSRKPEDANIKTI